MKILHSIMMSLVVAAINFHFHFHNVMITMMLMKKMQNLLQSNTVETLANKEEMHEIQYTVYKEYI